MEAFTSLEDINDFVQRNVGARLFTISVMADNRTSMARVYTSHPDVYPVGGKKTFARDTSSIWLEQVIEGHSPFLGKDLASVRSFFFDHETIESLGCGAIVNVPVLDDGTVIGSINMLDAEGAYDEQTVETAVEVARNSAELLRRIQLSFDAEPSA